MRLRDRRRNDEIEVNLTPLIDVVFLLLIFFMLTTTFEKEARLNIQLPSASSGEQHPTPTKPAEITISATGEIQLTGAEGEPWRAALQQRASSDPETPIILRADRETPHHAVVEVMDGVRILNLFNLSIMTEQAR